MFYAAHARHMLHGLGAAVTEQLDIPDAGAAHRTSSYSLDLLPEAYSRSEINSVSGRCSNYNIL